MPNDSREVILAGIRGALKQSQSAHDSATAPIERGYRRAASLPPEERLALFTERLREYDARVTVASPDEIAGAIEAIVAESRSGPNSDRSSFWVVADGFPPAWLQTQESFRWESQASIEDMDRCAGVLTTCSAGIALTGTILLQHGLGEGKRRTSLLPDRHLCIIRPSQVVETVPEAFQRLASAATRPLTFISGPSATADIEMTRIRGVHGPRRLDVILLNA